MTYPTVEQFLNNVRKNPAILDSLPKGAADVWRKAAGLDKPVKQTSAARISTTDLGFSLQIDERSTLEQAIDFTLQLQMMLNLGVINQEIWTMGVSSIQAWMLENSMDWSTFLPEMEKAVAA